MRILKLYIEFVVYRKGWDCQIADTNCEYIRHDTGNGISSGRFAILFADLWFDLTSHDVAHYIHRNWTERCRMGNICSGTRKGK